MTARRTFLHGAAGLSLAAMGLSALAAQPARPLVIDALGGIDNINLSFAQREDPATFGIDARALADAKASGLTAFNMTIGYVFGAGDPYEKAWPTPAPGTPSSPGDPTRCAWCAPPPTSNAPGPTIASA